LATRDRHVFERGCLVVVVVLAGVIWHWLNGDAAAVAAAWEGEDAFLCVQCCQ